VAISLDRTTYATNPWQRRGPRVANVRSADVSPTADALPVSRHSCPRDLTAGSRAHKHEPERTPRHAAAEVSARSRTPLTRPVARPKSERIYETTANGGDERRENSRHHQRPRATIQLESPRVASDDHPQNRPLP